MIDVEAIRRAHRPGRIATLFVGESAPVSGDFFYRGNPLMMQIVMSAIEESLPGQGTIASFKANGWYLDDLSITPIDNLRGKARRDACVAARESLAERIAKHKPLAIVSLMLGIREDVEAAMTIAGCNVRHINTPFPGMGQQRKFRDQMRRSGRRCRDTGRAIESRRPATPHRIARHLTPA